MYPRNDGDKKSVVTWSRNVTDIAKEQGLQNFGDKNVYDGDKEYLVLKKMAEFGLDELEVSNNGENHDGYENDGDEHDSDKDYKYGGGKYDGDKHDGDGRDESEKCYITTDDEIENMMIIDNYEDIET